jgi:hypothetical protein
LFAFLRPLIRLAAALAWLGGGFFLVGGRHDRAPLLKAVAKAQP